MYKKYGRVKNKILVFFYLIQSLAHVAHFSRFSAWFHHGFQ